MKPEYPEWQYPFFGIVSMCIVLALAAGIVTEGRHKPANPVIRQLIDRT
jgi:hypothetical protein